MLEKQPEPFYTVEAVFRLTNAPPANIRAWYRNELVSASGSPRRERKQRHDILFSFVEVLEIGIIHELKVRGADTRRIRKALNFLRTLGPELMSQLHLGASLPAELRKKAWYLDVSGDDILFYENKSRAMSAVKTRGQMILYCLMINVPSYKENLKRKVIRDVQSGRIADLAPTPAKL